jgi:hypothetical protein
VKGYRFFLEHGSKQNKRKGAHEGNVLALIDTMGDGFRPQLMGDHYGNECIGAVLFYPDSPVCGSSTNRGYLSETCKRISEAKARSIHPNLFVTLDRIEREERDA